MLNRGTGYKRAKRFSLLQVKLIWAFVYHNCMHVLHVNNNQSVKVQLTVVILYGDTSLFKYTHFSLITWQVAKCNQELLITLVNNVSNNVNVYTKPAACVGCYKRHINVHRIKVTITCKCILVSEWRTIA